MRSYNLLSLLQLTTLVALLLIGATTYYALYTDTPQTATTTGLTLSAGGSSPTGASGGGPSPGKSLWNENGCGSCHMKSMKDVGTGPALSGVTSRWAGEPREHLHAWIKNSVALAESGRSPRAAEMVDWSNTSMSTYTHLDSTSIEALLSYIEAQ